MLFRSGVADDDITSRGNLSCEGRLEEVKGRDKQKRASVTGEGRSEEKREGEVDIASLNHSRPRLGVGEQNNVYHWRWIT